MRFTITYLIVVLYSLSIYAQDVIVGEPYQSESSFEVLDQSISEYELIKMDVQKKNFNISANNPLLKLDLGNRNYTLNLYQNNLKVSFENDDLPLLLGGSLRDGGDVSLTINDNFIYGFIKRNDAYLFIEPLRNFEKGAASDVFVVYYAHHVIENSEHKCGVHKTQEKTEAMGNQKALTTLCKLMDLGIANTYDMVTDQGSVANVITHNLAILNNVQTNYRSEFTSNIEFDVVSHFVPASNGADPFPSSSDADILINAFISWGSGGANNGGSSGGFGVDYQMGQLWTDRNISQNGSSGVVGYATIGGSQHQVLENYTSAAPNLMSMVSHETGHNLGYNHDATGSFFIMSPTVALTTEWSSASVNTINTYVGNQTYLDPCSDNGAPTANFFQGALAVCTGSIIEYEDQSQYGATRAWVFDNGTPATGTDEKESVTYNNSGLHYIKLTSTNAAGSDDFYGYVDVESEPSNPCSPSGSGGGGGITNVTLENISNQTGDASTAGRYENFCCTEIASLDASTAYNLFFTMTSNSSNSFRIYADYNGDGDFLDVGESVGNYTIPNSGNWVVPITTPSGPTLETILRLRLIIDDSSISNACHNPSFGQVEDYGIYFEVAQTLGCTDPAASNYDSNATVDDGTCTYGMTTWYRDFDSDNYGDPLVTTSSSSQPAGFVADNTDCDDTDNTVFPGADEICDGKDNNCNNLTDEGLLTTYYADTDNDTFGDPNNSIDACTLPNGYVTNDNDCDDNDGNNFPGNTEVCDGQDNNCNGMIDENGLTTFYADLDNDNYGDPNVSIDACFAPLGFVLDNSDCDDNDSNNFPGNTEVCDGQDNNCDGMIDEGVLNTYYADTDNDGFGDPTNSTEACSAPANFVSDNTDCDDSDSNNYPGNTEVCDGFDNNCDGIIDEGCGPLPPCDNTNLVINNVTQNKNTYRAEINLESNALVNSSNSILFTAGTNIDLVGPFEVTLGTNFEASAEPCDNTNLQDGNGEDEAASSSKDPIGELYSTLTNMFDENKILKITLADEGHSFVSVFDIQGNLKNILSEIILNLEVGKYELNVTNGSKDYTKKIEINP